MSLTLTQKHPPIPLTDLVGLLNEFESMSFEDKRALIKRIVDIHPIANLEWGPGWRYRRARLLNDTVCPSNVDELIWNKKSPAKLGRANGEGFQVIYMADRKDTALREAGILDDTAVLAEFEIQPGHHIRIAPIGELIQTQRTGRGYLTGNASAAVTQLINACNLDEARSLLISDSFLLNCLANKQDDYQLSSTVAMNVLNRFPDISALCYPSVRQLGAVNFAVRVDNFWKNWGLRSARVGKASHLAQGFYKFSNSKHLHRIEPDGGLFWGGKATDRDEIAVQLEPLWVDSR